MFSEDPHLTDLFQLPIKPVSTLQNIQCFLPFLGPKANTGSVEGWVMLVPGSFHQGQARADTLSWAGLCGSAWAGPRVLSCSTATTASLCEKLSGPGIPPLARPRKMRHGCVFFNTSFLPLLEEIAMKLLSRQGPVVGSSCPGHRAAFPDLVHCSMFPKLSPMQVGGVQCSKAGDIAGAQQS